MPKIKTYEIYISGVKENLIIWYTESNGFHLKNFPERVLNIIESRIGALNSPDLKGLLIKIDKAVKQYEERIRTRKKVIYIKSRIGSETFDRVCTYDRTVGKRGGASHRVDPDFKSFDSDFGDDNLRYGFVFEYALGYVYTEGDKKYHTVLDDNFGDPGINTERFPGEYRCSDDNFIVLEWTQKREDFFAQLAEQLDQAAEAFAEFFRKTDDTVKFIDSGKHLLLPGVKKK